jgi:hypothetical protein
MILRLKYPIFIVLFHFATSLFSQEKTMSCQDVVYMKGGSIFRGTVTAYEIGGNLVMRTWGGAQMQLPASNVRRIVQQCKDTSRVRANASEKPYTFSDHGWYHSTRFSILTSAEYSGLGVQHSSGKKINQYLGVGMGIGLEKFDPYWDVPTVPVFAEIRGYLLPNRIAPFYAFGVGYGFSKKASTNGFSDGVESWKGGWMAQGNIGYRIGNHFTIQFGIRLQRKKHSWNNFWAQSTGIDQIRYRRLDVGIGLLL